MTSQERLDKVIADLSRVNHDLLVLADPFSSPKTGRGDDRPALSMAAHMVEAIRNELRGVAQRMREGR